MGLRSERARLREFRHLLERASPVGPFRESSTLPNERKATVSAFSKKAVEDPLAAKRFAAVNARAS